MENQRHIDVQARADEMHKTQKKKNKTKSRNRNLIKTFIITICVVLLPCETMDPGMQHSPFYSKLVSVFVCVCCGLFLMRKVEVQLTQNQS